MFKGTLNGELFVEYVKEVLAPMLREGDVVILDNLTAHKVKNALKQFRYSQTLLVYHNNNYKCNKTSVTMSMLHGTAINDYSNLVVDKPLLIGCFRP
jgi:hypothetical protein